LIYQNDFANRMIPKPNSKDYSRLSVGIYYKTHCKKLEVVSRNCFFPVPKVDSCIVELIPRSKPPFNVFDESTGKQKNRFKVFNVDFRVGHNPVAPI